MFKRLFENKPKSKQGHEPSELDAIREEVEAGLLKRFMQLEAPDKALIISGNLDKTVSPINWKKISQPQQVKLLALLEGVSFERLYLQECTGLTLAALETLLRFSPKLKELSLGGHDFIEDRVLEQLLRHNTQLNVLILIHLPNLLHIKKTSQSLVCLKSLMVSHNPNLETLIIDAPFLRTLKVQNNDHLHLIKTHSHKLNIADLRNNPRLTREGIEESLASKKGFRHLTHLFLGGSNISEAPLLENLPILLTHESQSEAYKILLVLIPIYLGNNWQNAPLSSKQKSHIRVLMGFDLKDWFFRYEVIGRLEERFKQASPLEQEQIRLLILNYVQDGYSQVANKAIIALLETYKTASLTKWFKLLTNNEMRWPIAVQPKIAKALQEYCQRLTKDSRSRFFNLLFKSMQGKNGHLLSLLANILAHCYRFATFYEQDQILTILQELSGKEENKDYITRCGAIEALAQCYQEESDIHQQDEILSYLLWLLKDEDPFVHTVSLQALGTCYKKVIRRQDELFSYLYLDESVTALEVLGTCYENAPPSHQVKILEIGLKKAKINHPACAFAIQLLGYCYPRAILYQTQILEIALYHGQKAYHNPSIHCSVAQTLAVCYPTAISEKRLQILFVLNEMIAYSDKRQNAALDALGACCKLASSIELEHILSLLLDSADKHKESHHKITLILHGLGQLHFSSLSLQTLLESFKLWSIHSNSIVRKILVQGLWGWVERKRHSDHTKVELFQILKKIIEEDPYEKIKWCAKLALVKLQTCGGVAKEITPKNFGIFADTHEPWVEEMKRHRSSLN